MQISKKETKATEIDYDTLIKIQEHAKEYNNVNDKKGFLKNIGAYEQKLILLDSKRPLEVLFNLDELQLPTTKRMLEELTFDEITKILYLLSSEDKEYLYNNFSDLDFVNRIIVRDKNAVEHLEDLEIDRKIELLNSSDSNTVEASSKVYETIEKEDRFKVVHSMDNTDSLGALTNSEAFKESISTKLELPQSDSKQIEERVVEKVEEKIEEKQEEKQEEKKEDKKEEKKEENKKEEDFQFSINYEEKVEYFKSNFVKYKEKFPEIEKIDMNDPKFFTKLAADLVSLVESDIRKERRRKKENMGLEQEQTSLEKFKQVQQECEEKVVSNLENQISQEEFNNQQDMVIDEPDANVKTL